VAGVARDNTIPDDVRKQGLRIPDESGMIPIVNQNTNRTNPDELVALAEAAQRLGIAYDTARKRLKAGSLEGERRGGRWFIRMPEAEERPEMGPERDSGQPSEHSGPFPDETEPIPDVLVAQLRDEIGFLRQQVERQNHIIAGLIQRVPLTAELGTGEIITVDPERADAPESDERQNAAMAANYAPLRDDTHSMADMTLHQARDVPQRAGESVVRRWWRKIVGG